MLWEPPPEGLRRRHVDGERVEGTPQEEVDGVRRRVRTLLSGRPARVAEGQRPDGARAGALEPLDVAECCRMLGRRSDVGGLARPLSGTEIMIKVVSDAKRILGPNHKNEDFFNLRLADCYLEENLVTDALALLQSMLRSLVDERSLGEDQPLVIHVRWRYAKALHKYHFFGHAGYRNTLRLAVCSLVALGGEAVGVFGPPEHHPMTRDIVRSVKHAVDEQLDWTLDDFPPAIRAVLLQQNYYGQA